MSQIQGGIAIAEFSFVRILDYECRFLHHKILQEGTGHWHNVTSKQKGCIQSIWWCWFFKKLNKKLWRARHHYIAKSWSGWVITYINRLIILASKLQTQVALSTTEAEFISLPTGLRDTIPLMLMARDWRKSLILTFIEMQLMSFAIALRTTPMLWNLPNSLKWGHASNT